MHRACRSESGCIVPAAASYTGHCLFIFLTQDIVFLYFLALIKSWLKALGVRLVGFTVLFKVQRPCTPKCVHGRCLQRGSVPPSASQQSLALRAWCSAPASNEVGCLAHSRHLVSSSSGSRRLSMKDTSREEPHRVNGLSLYLLRQELNLRCPQSPVGVLVTIARPGAVTRGFWSAVRHALRGMAGRKR